MKASKSCFILGVALACAALTLSLAVCAQSQTVTFLYQFTGEQAIATSLIQGTDGNFYGAAGAGAFDEGQIFRMTPSGELTTVYSFCARTNCPDGNTPVPLMLASDGNFYGETWGGGAYNLGTIFRMTLDGKITTLYSFCSSSGCGNGLYTHGVIQASDGNFYGSTPLGGVGNNGILFRISSTGAFKLLYTFCSLAICTDGSGPGYPPIEASDGNFYGVTAYGGISDGGVFYRLTPEGAYKVLYNFCNYDVSCETGNRTGSRPQAVVQDTNGNFLGTTLNGGNINNDGTIFEITPPNQYQVLHRFDSNNEYPAYGLTLANDGNFYGATEDNGYTGDGTIFEFTPESVYTPLFTFECCNEGYDPAYGPLFQGTDGSLYGTTLYSAGACCYGTIFSLSNNLSPLVETAPLAGKVGQSVLILGNNLTGSSSVTFNGVAAKFTVESDTYIKATVPTGATTGTVSVVTPSGTLKSNPQFLVTK
jgi:uncharacterized repeat protein (TIGR03803 family)